MLKLLLKKEIVKDFILEENKNENEVKLIEEIIKEFEGKNKDFLYPCIYREEVKKVKKEEILIFLNNNYKYKDDKFSLNYSYELFDYYTKKCIIVELRNHYKIVGIIIGCKKIISCGNKLKEFIEVNMLCLDEKARNKNITSYLKSLLKREALNCGIYNGYYMNTNINTVNKGNFCVKKVYTRPLDIGKMESIGFLSFKSKLCKDLYKKVYSTFSYKFNYLNERYIKYNPINVDLFMLSKKLKEYYKDKFKIYEHGLLSEESLKILFKNDCFDKFVIYNKSDEIVDFVCIYKLNIINNNTFNVLKNGYVYLLLGDDAESLLEVICEYLYKNDIIDMLSVYNNFKINYIHNKFVSDNTTNSYYMCNKNDCKISSYFNGLTTI